MTKDEKRRSTEVGMSCKSKERQMSGVIIYEV